MPQAIDEAWSKADPAAAKAAGVEVVSMYLSHDASKDATASYIKAYHAEGIGVLLNFEWYEGRPAEGYAAGHADALSAAAEVDSLIREVGYAPANKLAIPFSCDFDAQPWQYDTVASYYQGAKDGLAGRFHVGVYGSFYVVEMLAKRGITEMEWQAYAWSEGKWSEYADFEQVLNGQTVGGGSVDFDRVMHATEAGIWWPPGHPNNNPNGADADMAKAEVDNINQHVNAVRDQLKADVAALQRQINALGDNVNVHANQYRDDFAAVQAKLDKIAAKLGV